MIIVVEKNKNDKIELTKEELEKLLEEAKQEGFRQGKDSITYIPYTPNTIPYNPWTPSITWTCNSSCENNR